MLSDRELLLQYARQGDEAEFAELVRRHADLVYSVALRITRNGALAQDVTQVVFTELARQAGRLGNYASLAGWLHTVARRRAIDAVRREERLHAREDEATSMQQINSTSETNWAEIGPLLDEAVGRLGEPDREAVLLRYFKNLSHREVGDALGLGEDAARKRVDRALEKLREHFARRGVTTSSALLATAITENSVQAAPVGLVASVTTASLAGVGNAIASGAILTAIYMTTKTKTILAAVVVLAIVTTLAIKWQSSSEPPVSTIATAGLAPKTLFPLFANLSKAPMPQVAAPKMAPVPAGGSSGPAELDAVSTGTLTLSSAPPNADLKTAIPSLAHYLEAKDFEHVIPFVMTPEEVQQALDNGQVASIEDLADLIQAKINGNTNGNIGNVVNALNAIQDQTPTMDDTQTQAVYQLPDPLNPVNKITFFKKDGLWYLY